MNKEKKVKLHSKNILYNGNWPNAIFSFIILILFLMTLLNISEFIHYMYENVFNFSPNTLSSAVLLLTSAILFFISSPIINGYIKFNYNMAKNGKGNILDNFYFFSNSSIYCKTLIFNLRWLLSFWPVLAISACGIYFFEYFNQLNSLLIGMLLLFIISIINIIYPSLRNFYAPLLFCEDDTNNISYYFKMSKEYCNSRLFILYLSFLPILLLCIFVLPAIFIIPYFVLSVTAYGRWIITENQSHYHNLTDETSETPYNQSNSFIYQNGTPYEQNPNPEFTLKDNTPANVSKNSNQQQIFEKTSENNLNQQNIFSNDHHKSTDVNQNTTSNPYSPPTTEQNTAPNYNSQATAQQDNTLNI